MPIDRTTILTAGLPAQVKARRDCGFLEDLTVLLPWAQMVDLVHGHIPTRAWPCWPHGASAMLRICFVQRWFGYGDECMADALFCSAAYRAFAGLSGMNKPLPDAQSIQAVRTLLDRPALALALLRAVQCSRWGDARVMAASSASDAALVVWFVSQETQLCAPPRRMVQGVAINA